MPWTKEDSNFKKLQNKRITTNVGKSIDEEKGASSLEFYITDIKTELIPGTPPGSSTSVLSYTGAIGQTLAVDTSVPNNLTWFATSSYGNTTLANDGSFASESARLQDWISDKYDAFGTVPGNGYEIKVYDKDSNLITKADPSDWLFDYQTGILIFNNANTAYGAVSSSGPFRVVGYRYVGQKGVIPGRFGGTGYTNFTKGDILVGAGATFIKLGVGSENYVLSIDSTTDTGLKWVEQSGGSATGIAISSTNDSGPFYPTFVNNTSGSGLAVSVDSNLSYNASTNTLTSSVFSGNLSATAATATNFYGELTGFATTSRNIVVTGSVSTNATHYMLFSRSNGGSGVTVQSSSNLQYNPSTRTLNLTALGKISASNIRIGNVSGTIDTDSGNLILDSTAGTVSVNDNMTVSGDLTAQTQLITGNIRSSSGGLAISAASGTVNINSNLTVLNTLTSSGDFNVDGSTSIIDSSTVVIRDPVIVLGAGLDNTHSLDNDFQDRGLEFRYAKSGVAITAFMGLDNTDDKFKFISNVNSKTGENIFGGNPGIIVASLEGTATTSQNISLVSSGSTNSVQYLVFSGSQTGSGVALSSGSGLTYNTASNTLFVQNIQGILSGSATTASNLNVNSASNSSEDHFILLSRVATGSGVAVSSGVGLSYNPNTNTLKIGGFGISSNLLTTNSSSVNIFNTPTTINAFQSGTAISFGAASGTFTVNNASLKINGTTNSSSVSSGALIVDGGLGLANNAFIGGTVNITSNQSSISSGSGALVVSGGVGIGGTLFVSSSNSASISGAVISNSVISNAYWAGNLITTNYGGLGLNTFSAGDILVGIGNTLIKVGAGTSGQILVLDDSVDYKVKWANNFILQNSVGLGTDTKGQYAKSIAVSNSGAGITITPANNDDGTDYIIYSNATSSNTSNALVQRDASGNFSANTITASLSGYATTARNITVNAGSETHPHFIPFHRAQTGDGVALLSDSTLGFNPGTDTFSATNISATSVSATNLTGTLQTNSQPNITGVGNITSGSWSATAISTLYGGTGLISYTKGDLLVGLGNTIIKLGVGADNTILTADSLAAIGVTWKAVLSPSYGAFGSTATQTVSASNTTTLINFDSVFESNNISATGTTTRIYVNSTGVYNLQFSARTNLGSGIGASNGEIWFKLDGSNLDTSNALTTIAKQDSDIVLTTNYVKNILAGSFIEIAMSSFDSNFQIKTRTSNNGPKIPSIYLSVLPVSSVVAGGGSAISGIAQLNTLTTSSQSFSTGKSGSNFNIQSSGSVHTFNIPDASESNSEGLITNSAQTIAGQKTFINDLVVNSTTESNSFGTGSIRTRGGLGVSGTASFGSTIEIYAGKADGQLAFRFDANQNEGFANFQLRHANFLRFYASNDSTYLDIKADPQSTFSLTLPKSDGVAGQFLARDTTGGLFFTSEVPSVSINSASSGSNQNLVFSSTTGSGSALSSNTNLKYNPTSNVLETSKLIVKSSEDATFYDLPDNNSSYLGALHVEGGIAVSKNLWARESISIGSTSSGRISLVGYDASSTDWGLRIFDGNSLTVPRVQITNSAGGSDLMGIAWAPQGGVRIGAAIRPAGRNSNSLAIVTLNASTTLINRIQFSSGSSNETVFTLGPQSSNHLIHFTGVTLNTNNASSGEFKFSATQTLGTGTPGGFGFYTANAGTVAGSTVNSNFLVFKIVGTGASIATTTSSTSASTGSFVTGGGLGVIGNAFIGGTVNLQSTTVSSNLNSGALVVSGGAAIGSTLNIGGRLSLWNGSLFTQFRSSQSGISTVYTLPSTTPESGTAILQSDSSGNLSWVTAASGNVTGTGTSAKVPLWTNGGIALTDSVISQSGIVIDIAGHLKAYTKSFLIPHPLDPENLLLEHGSLEGPEHGLYIRGTADGINEAVVEYPDYWRNLAKENPTIIISSKCPSSLYVSYENENGFKVRRLGFNIFSKKRILFDYFVIAQRKDVDLQLIHPKR